MSDLAGQEAAAATAPQGVEAAAGVEAPSIAPDHETPPKADAPLVEPPKIEASRIVVPKFEPKADTKPEPKPEPKAESKTEPKPGKLIVMAPSERSWDHD